MLKLLQLKKQQEEEKATKAINDEKNNVVSAAHKRVQKDLADFPLPPTMTLVFPNPSSLLNFTLTLRPDFGFYTTGTYTFTFTLHQSYPHAPPKVLCNQVLFHPNIDPQGNICLNILREDWKPVLGLNAVFVGLLMLFEAPNADDPLNKEAAELMRRDPSGFKRVVGLTMAGGKYDGVRYTRVI